VRNVVITIAASLVPSVALACPVCFGDASAPMTIAANRGIWFMLGVVAVMLSAFAAFFLYLRNRGRLAADSAARTERPETGFQSHRQGQEGTA
jgi:hypothetical protein